MINTKSQREMYGKVLVECGETHPELVVLEADLSKSTMGSLFEEAYPDNFFEMGIAESNMASTAAGLSLTGKTPFMASFAVFSTGRCYDQIRTNVCVPNLNVKICGSSAGLSDYGDGSTHQSIDDIAIMRVLPNMNVFSPADAQEAGRIVRYMIENKGPMYIRVNRNNLPDVTLDEPFVPGNVYTIKNGSDVAIFATGVMVSKSLEAAALLKENGIEAKVINVPSIKPIDKTSVMDSIKNIDCIITAEEHSVKGGLADAIIESISPYKAVKHIRIGVQDSFGTSADNYDALLEKYGLTAEHIKCAALEVMGK